MKHYSQGKFVIMVNDSEAMRCTGEREPYLFDTEIDAKKAMYDTYGVNNAVRANNIRIADAYKYYLDNFIIPF